MSVSPSPEPYPAYKPSGVEWLGDVPAHWEVAQLGRIGSFSKGTGGSKEDEVDEGVPCVRYGDLYTSHRYFIQYSRSYIAQERTLDYTPMEYGDVLFAGSGEPIEEIGKSAVNLIESQAYCGGDVILFRPQIELDARFSGYACQGRSENVPERRSKSVPLNLHLVSETMVGSSLELIPLNGGRSTGPGCCQSQGWRESRPVCSV